jgi:predicted MFS family arabinose efflux permease
MLLQAGQLLSSLGTQTSSVAYPLLVLALTHSPAQAGVVAFVRFLALTIASPAAGVVADRWNRKRLMITSDVVRFAAVAALATLILVDHADLWAIVLISFVSGAAAAVFTTAYAGAVRSVVPKAQIPDATSVQTGRQAAVSLAGPPLGGALFGVARALPFVVDAVSYACSALSLLAMRTPFQEERAPDAATFRTQLVEGMRFTWNRPFLRTCALLFGLTNFIGPGVLFAVVVIGNRQGLSGAEIGLLLAAFSACLLLGSFAARHVRRVLPVRAVLLLEFWTWAGCGVFLIWPDVYVLTAGTLVTALVIPSTDSVVHGYRIAMTPDRLLGRSESAWSTIALLISPFGPLLAGLLLGAGSARATIAVFAASGLALAVWGTLSPAIRSAPSLDDLTAAEEPAVATLS